jgi:predicted nucleic acid-binding protein
VALAALADFPLQRYAHQFLLSRMWDFRANMTAYDAVHVALAQAVDAPLLARDRRLAAAAKPHVAVDVV